MLYVARDKRRPQRHDLGSVLCLRVLDLLPRGTVQVHECRRGERRAPWLAGTPTLALEGGEVLRGHQALEHLQRLAVHLAAERGGGGGGSAKRAAPAPAGPADGLVARAAAPPPADEPGDGLWECTVEEAEDDEDTPRKITQEDMAQLMRGREAGGGGGGMPPGGERPAPEPMRD